MIEKKYRHLLIYVLLLDDRYDQKMIMLSQNIRMKRNKKIKKKTAQKLLKQTHFTQKMKTKRIETIKKI